MTKKQRLGELLVSNNLVTEEQIQEALRVQVGGNRRLGYLLVKMGVLTSDQLLDTLSQQLDVPIINVAEEFSPEVRNVLPRYLCRKYSVVPLRMGENNILTVAMMDPLDGEAIEDVEAFTGKVVKPVLARQEDLSRAAGTLIPFSTQDVFNAQVYSKVAKVATLCVVILLVIVGSLLYRYIQTEKFGTVSVVGNTTLYENHDLTLAFEDNGRTTIQGHGAYSAGLYSVSFDDVKGIARFVEQKKKNFSEKQYDWVLWVIEQKEQK